MRFIFYILYLIFSTSLFPDEYENTSFEFGLRYGIGMMPDNSFERGLKNFNLNPFSVSLKKNDVTSINPLIDGEFNFYIRWLYNFKIGLILGQTNYSSSKFKSISSDPSYTSLQFNMNNQYFIITYNYEWIFKRFHLETGLGLGINQTNVYLEGVNFFNSKFNQIDGVYLNGTGLSYRGEVSFNKQIIANTFFQFGLVLNFHTIPGFNGNLASNSGSSFYLNSDGSVSYLSVDQYKDSIIQTNYAVRKLDMAAGNLILFFGTKYRLNF